MARIDGMILYYAPGGGLGHVSRSVAILKKSAWLSSRSRILASTPHAFMAGAQAPCPVDQIDSQSVTSKVKFTAFLADYIQRHGVKMMIVDTFPAGVTGELNWINLNFPILLVTRHVKWDAYTIAAGGVKVRYKHTLAVEPLDLDQEKTLADWGDVSHLDAPVAMDISIPVMRRPGALVVHSGAREELVELIRSAQELPEGKENVDVISPETGIYPAELRISEYAAVVSGAGYNMAAVAAQAPHGRNHLLIPFPRRYDDQSLRNQRIAQGMWRGSCGDGAQKAACWLEERARIFYKG